MKRWIIEERLRDLVQHIDKYKEYDVTGVHITPRNNEVNVFVEFEKNGKMVKALPISVSTSIRSWDAFYKRLNSPYITWAKSVEKHTNEIKVAEVE